MKDLIDRQAAIEAARDWYEGLICGSFKGLEKRLRALPSAEPKSYRMGYQAGYKAAQRWIPCSKELPKKNGDYYVTTHDGQITRYMFIKGMSEEYWMRCAIAWRPLPEPYKEKT